MFTKKILSHIILSYLVISTTILPFPVNTNTQLSNETKDSIATPYAEETEWVYRFYDGKYQKRLWSITYEKWLTNWILVQ